MSEQPIVPIEPVEEHTSTYEPPQVEAVMTADDLAREVQYAGVPSLVLE